ncbi:MAG: 50S ribosomal protein L15 [Candidatus Raymondbacteria bacterium RifOxyA12_full_50_37]|uniref:Large ribosomal subunit protein uL15 n=1 Tax=Candidatus Raymondbacteria bacterium RIFOXYD12_FULL_49_13 TaxID=1817890 RepID=A0A1F7FD74_UNCRA|nr:ribosomal protein L15 [uncultured bacterium]OGJ88096.1 MAG: 50S ribosomal protein L15 [Candidatus Raymondbacteria bacterium RifOxyA12_full_50_37]OGJ94073.1 MAG: 50S ribosomal protein L15 [Candidatus Raymondbacteria bacterium RIFOXYA2_FULL_49_16]OGJ96828.1 MAG: 50S ribosomal protein L15 [Candidatus Raymondbacteria bacterium RifOxyC12_full_50_8]OGJ96898.1 MAG: 50S ribosomal protein L15 [Candidatus Raymondbacteria bacterium RIFOXYC2_FULL_50_21]OGK01512.1 MAG: 50S ribosomal protein L15 [Candida
MYLSNLTRNKGAARKSKKIGRGSGSGHGCTACKGNNGANARSGARHKPGFEGGQMPLQRRLPKRGFYNHFSEELVAVNLSDIVRHLGDASLVDTEFLFKKGIVKSPTVPVKVLGDGNLDKAVTIRAASFSASAKEKIEKNGGKAEIV